MSDTERTAAGLAWEAWQEALRAEAMRSGVAEIDTSEYRDYFEDGDSPADAWVEDCSYAD